MAERFTGTSRLSGWAGESVRPKRVVEGRETRIKGRDERRMIYGEESQLRDQPEI